MLGSLVWEIFCERALPSVNDVITTPLSGAVFGEALHRLYYSAESLPAALRFFISPFDFLNRYLPGGNPPAKPTGELWQLDAQAGLFFGVQSRANLNGLNPSAAFAPGASVALNAVYGNPFETYGLGLTPLELLSFPLLPTPATQFIKLPYPQTESSLPLSTRQRTQKE